MTRDGRFCCISQTGGGQVVHGDSTRHTRIKKGFSGPLVLGKIVLFSGLVYVRGPENSTVKTLVDFV